MEEKQDFKEKTYRHLLAFLKEELSDINNKDCFSRFEIEIKDNLKDIDLIDFLYNQEAEVKTYWSSRSNNFEIAAIGFSDILRSSRSSYGSCGFAANTTLSRDLQSAYEKAISRLSSSKNIVRYYACISFNSSDDKTDIWDKFGKYYMIVPEFEFFKKDGKSFFAFNLFCNNKNREEGKEYIEGALKRFLKINTDFIKNTNKKQYLENFNAIKRTDIPDKNQWIKNIKSLISEFSIRKISKVVLARKTLIELDEKADSINIIKLLKNININTYNFCFKFDSEDSFLGCSPELLFSRRGKIISSDAIAGTCSYSKDSDTQNNFSPSLLNSIKDFEEYKFVYDSIKTSLEKISSSIKIIKNKEILQLSYLQHICSQFEAVINEGVDDFRAMCALHPTPAVAGYPKYESIKFINKYEPFPRGFYCGPVGWFTFDESEFAVAIRSSIINKNNIILFSGAGIVQKSDPSLEWDEIENKIDPFLRITNLL